MAKRVLDWHDGCTLFTEQRGQVGRKIMRATSPLTIVIIAWILAMSGDAQKHLSASSLACAASSTEPGSKGLQMKGKVTAVRPEMNEFVLSENFKSWTFQLAKGAKVFVNGQEGPLTKLHAGDVAAVEYTRQGTMMLASMVKAMRE
jgi:hypothetical protein